MKKRQLYRRNVSGVCLACHIVLASLLFPVGAFAAESNANGLRLSAPQAQNVRIIKGIVKDANNEPLPGATVQIKGTTTGVVTDIDGKYSLTVPSDPNATLIISFVGMKTKEVKIGKLENINVTLEEESQALEQVVVNGVFERKANTFTGSVQTFDKEQLKRVGNSNVFESLKNLDPSVMFFDNMSYGSDPNTMPSMAMRGKSSLNLTDTDLRASYQNDPNAPLFILDGFEVSIQKIMDLDMDRVESLTLLKDASAKAIYGSKAANGVIVIELKKNTDGQLRVTYNGSVSVEMPDLTSYDLCNAEEKLDVEYAYGMYTDPNANFDNQRTMNRIYNQKRQAVVSGINTDWISKPLHVGVGHKHSLSVELGEKALKAIIDLSYNNVKGVMKGSDRSTISGALSLQYRHNKFLFRNQLTITSNKANDSKYGSFDEYTRLNPYYSPYDEYGNLVENIFPHIEKSNSVSTNAWFEQISFEANPLWNAKLNTLLQNKYIDVTNNFDLQWFVTTGLKATARFGLTEKRSRKDNFYPANHLKFHDYVEDRALEKGSYELEQGQQSDLSGKLDIQYNKNFKEVHSAYINVGLDIAGKKFTTNVQQAQGFPSDKMNDLMFARQWTENTKPTGTEQTIRDFGYYLSANYSYDNRINIDGTFRQSASSQYGADSRWGKFWSAGASWNIHNEDWLEDSNISQLRLRASVGSTGSQSMDAYNAIASYEYFLDKTYEGLLGAQLIGMRNPDLKWQEKMEYNFGVDFNYKNRYSLQFEWYRSITNNALNPLTLVPSTGFNSVSENVGKIQNTGFDLKASATVWQNPKERSYLTFNVMISRNKNILKEISAAMRAYNEQQNAQFANSNADNYDQRKPLNKFYDGVSMDAIWAMPSLGIDPANGREVFLVTDANGVKRRTYTYDANAQVVCGDALPKFQGNGGVSFQYKGIGFNTVLTYQYGAKMYNQTLVDKVENANMNDNVDRRIFTDRWRQPGDHKPFKAIGQVYISEKEAYATDEMTRPTSRFVQKRNELHISSVQLSYDFFKHAFIKKAGLERLQVKFNINDLYTFSSIKIERGTYYPFARTFNVSLSATFK